MISSEQIEIVHICDRAYVMRSGRIAGELAHHELTEANIVRLGIAPMSARSSGLQPCRLARVPGVAHRAGRAVRRLSAWPARDFATPANIANILMQSTILLLLALPMTLIIMTEGLDLSMGAVLTFASIVLAVTVIATGSPALGLPGGARRRARASASPMAC